MPLDTISLSGEWQFRAGEQGGWLPLAVPGCWESLGIPHDWEGPGWYRKIVEIPLAWRTRGNERLWLRFGAVSYACQVQVNGIEVGTHRGAWDAFVLEITETVRDMPTAEILVRVVKPGGPTYPTNQTASGFLPYVWGFLFGGIWQEVTLERTGPERLPDFPPPPRQPDRYLPVGVTQEFDPPFPAPDASRPRGRQHPAEWSPEKPRLMTVRTHCHVENELSDERIVRTAEKQAFPYSSQIYLNNQVIYPRMALSWGWYPETLHCNPPVETMRVELQKLQQLGYNGVKCCLWVPPPAYLDLCDELGMLVWMELPLWLPQMNAEQWEQIYREYEAIVTQLAHHPCIVIWSLGCELSSACPTDFMKRLYEQVRLRTSNALLRDNSGGGECYGGALIENADYYDYHFYCDLPFLRSTFDYFLPRTLPVQPWLFGEFCDADACRDLPALQAAHGGALPWWAVDDPARNPKGARWDMHITGQWKALEQNGLFSRLEELKAGQRRQTLLHRKFTVELVRTYEEMSGYVITGLRDTPISTAGMFDDFGAFRYTPEEFTRFNADTVLLLSWHRRRNWVAGGDRPSYVDVWTRDSGETILPRLGISHYGKTLQVLSGKWELLDADGGQIAVQGLTTSPHAFYRGQIAAQENTLLPTIDRGYLGPLTETPFELPQVSQMTRLLLRATLRLRGKRTVQNEWPLWVVPHTEWQELPAWAAFDPDERLKGLERHGAVWTSLSPTEIAGLPIEAKLVASRWTAEIAAFIRRGGHAFVFVDRGGGLPTEDCPFWREAMKLFEPHPLWTLFPHEGFTDLNFYGLGPDCALQPAAVAALFPDADLHPLLRRVDARTCAVTDYLTEARFASGGRLLLSTLRPQGGLGDQPDGLLRHTAGRYLLASILQTL